MTDAATSSPVGTPARGSLQLTQYSHFALLRAPQFGQIRRSGCFVAFTISFRLHRQRRPRQRISSGRRPAPHRDGPADIDFYRQTAEPALILFTMTSPLLPSLALPAADPGAGGACGGFVPMSPLSR